MELRFGLPKLNEHLSIHHISQSGGMDIAQELIVLHEKVTRVAVAIMLQHKVSAGG
jgi:hypothetical protein